MMLLDWIERYWEALVMMTSEMAPYLLLGFLIAGLLRMFVSRSVYSKHLAPRNMKSVVKAAAIGVPLPLCSCGVIPTTVGLRKEGASHGACTSFLIATPQTGVDSIAATYSLMGLPFAIVRPLAALFTAMFGGWMVNRFAREDEATSAQMAAAGEQASCSCGDGHCHHPHETTPTSMRSKLLGALEYAFVDMMQDVGKWLIIGLLIAALITVAVPNEWLAALHDYKLLNMLIVLAVAIPMYVCATGSIPIAVSLMAKGLTPGAALVLLMAGPAVNSASILVIGKVFGKRTLTLYILSIVIGAIAFGLGIDYLLPPEWFAVHNGIAGAGTHCTHGLTPLDWVWIVLLALLLMNAFWQGQKHNFLKHSPSLQKGEPSGHDHEHSHDHEHVHCHDHEHVYCHEHEHGHESDADAIATYKIKGMSCNHCKANVERAIRGVSGVTGVEVDLQGGKAVVRGRHDTAALIERVGSYGYEASAV